MRVLVVGGGIGGLTAGAALGRLGHAIDIAETAGGSAAAGVGIAQPANALRVMRELGLLERCLDAGFQYDRSVFCDAAGRVVVEVPSVLGGDGLPAANALSRRALHEILTDAAVSAGAEVRYGVALTNVVADGTSALATFSNSATASYDLVLGFDGTHSTVRSRLFAGAAEPTYTGHSVWRLTVPRPPEVACPLLFHARRTKAGVIPLSEETMYLLAVTTEHRASRFARADFADLLRERLEEFSGLIEEIREAPIEAEDVVYSPIEEVLLPAPWHRGVVAVAGDAAHACAPHLTQGAAMAMEDALVLASLLDDAVPVRSSVADWCARRYPRCRAVQDVSHAILAAEAVEDAGALAARLERMPGEVPGRLHAVQRMLSQPP